MLNAVLNLFKDNDVSVAFYVGTSHFICSANQVTGFYIRCNTCRFGVFIVNFEHIEHVSLVFSFITLNMLLLAKNYLIQ